MGHEAISMFERLRSFRLADELKAARYQKANANPPVSDGHLSQFA